MTVDKNVNVESIADRYSLSDNDKRILELRFKFPGIENQEIAEALSLAKKYISERTLRPAMQRAMSEHAKTVYESAIDLQKIAIARLKKLVNDPDKQVALAAIRIAMAPMTNQHFVNVRNSNSQDEKAVYEVKLGENGQVLRGFKTTKELLEENTIDVSTTT